MRSTSRPRSMHASQQALLLVALLLFVSLRPVPAAGWGQWFNGFGHAVKDAALNTADPRLWDIVDGGKTSTPSAGTSNPSLKGNHPSPDAVHSSLQDTGSQSQQQRLAAGLQVATAASPAAAAAALTEAFSNAQLLIDQALTAVLDQHMPGPAEEGFKQALDAFLQAETHLRDWGLALLSPEASTPAAAGAAGAAGAATAKHPDQLRQHGMDQLRIVVKQLQLLLPQDVAAESSQQQQQGAAAGTPYARCIAAHPKAAAAAAGAAGSGPHSPADDILASLTCLEQLTTGLAAAGDGSAAAGDAGGSDSAAAAASGKESGTGAAWGLLWLCWRGWLLCTACQSPALHGHCCLLSPCKH